ncbi:MAG: flagellin [Verrucomicrobiota bacterium]
MRVTQNLFSDSLVGRLGKLTTRQYELQNQVSSGLKVQAPSDNPGAMQSVLHYKNSQVANETYADNAAALQTRAATVYNVLQQLSTISSNVGVTATAAGDVVQKDLSVYAGSVDDALESALEQVNKKDPTTGQYLFGGTASAQPPFVATRDASGKVTAVAYQGNSSVNFAEIGDGATATADVLGSSASGTRGLITDSISGADFFNHLISLRDHLLANDKTSLVNTDIPALRKDEDNFLYQISVNGSLQSRLESAKDSSTESTASLNKLISGAADADIIDTMVQMTQAQTSYQAALQSGAKIMQLSLLNYLQ